MAFNFRSPNPCLPYNQSEGPETSPRITLTSSVNQLRVADVLKESEDFFEGLQMSEEEDHRTVLYCSSPRRIMGRWLSGFRKRKLRASEPMERERSGECKLEKRERDEPAREASGIVGGAVVSRTSVSVPASKSSESGSVTRESSMNFGIAFCLLHLVAASKNELSKIVEMRKQVEMLLQKAKSGLENQSKSQEIGANSTSDELETELQSELALLNLRLDDEATIPGSIQQQNQMAEQTESSETQRGECGEVIDPQQTGISSNGGGVSPHELERKLQEVLLSRQEEQIRELTADLQCLKIQLLEKEMEISWWKDATRMISKRLPEPLALIDSSPEQTPTPHQFS